MDASTNDLVPDKRGAAFELDDRRAPTRLQTEAERKGGGQQKVGIPQRVLKHAVHRHHDDDDERGALIGNG